MGKRRSPKAPPEDESWVWIPTEVLGSSTFRALSVHALRFINFLLLEHALHAGEENGRLGAPYRQLEEAGMTQDDVSKGLREVELTGFVRVTHQGFRIAGGSMPSRYAVTWFSVRLAGQWYPPSNDWKRVLSELHGQQIRGVRSVRSWLKAEVPSRGRGGRRWASGA